MGVLRFMRWICLTYPKCLLNLRGTYKTCQSAQSAGVVSEWLMFDLNSVFHPVAQELHKVPEAKPASLRRPRPAPLPPAAKPDKIIYEEICKRLEEIRAIIQPTQGIYFAIDGTAGLSKMCQQRKRRFKAALDKKEISGIITWDSTKISCGTEWMDALGQYIDGWIKKQMTENPDWKSLQIIFSDHRVHSEGEHKLLEYMRKNPHLSYTVVSPDADLIFLASGLHNPNIWIFRENIFDDVEANFFLLHVGSFRNCILEVIDRIKSADAEQRASIEDFIAFCFFIGNDFLPQIPSLNVSNEGIEIMLKLYRKIVVENGPLLERNIGSSYRLRSAGIRSFLRELAQTEEQMMVMNYTKNRARIPDPLLRKHLCFSLSAEGIPSEMSLDMARYKANYYQNKFHGVEPRIIVHEYLRGMLFVARYYLEGIPSWTWSYPFTYAPLFSDLAEHSETFDWEYKWEPSTPLSPFEQLLAILPGKNAYLLPEPLRPLSLSPASPIADFYPIEFDFDMEGKKEEYEAVILLPHIEPERLQDAFKLIEPQLSQTDRERNLPGKIVSYRIYGQNLIME